MAEVVAQVEKSLLAGDGDGVEIRAAVSDQRAMPVTQVELGGAARVVRGDFEVELIRHVPCPLAAQASGTPGPTAISTQPAVGRAHPRSLTADRGRDRPRTRASSGLARVAATNAYDSLQWRHDVWKGRVSGLLWRLLWRLLWSGHDFAPGFAMLGLERTKLENVRSPWIPTR